MASVTYQLNRREMVAGMGAAALAPSLSPTASAQGRPSLILQAKAGRISLNTAGPDTPIWSLAETANSAFRFKRGEALEITLANDLPVSIALNWRGVDGVAAAEPLLARSALAPGAKESFVLPLRHAGTFVCDARLLGDGEGLPSSARALVVGESEAVSADRDEVFLIEDWRLRPDGSAIAPAVDPKDAKPVFTVNGRPTLDIPVRVNERLRLRFVNGCQRNVIAVKLDGQDVRVMSLDGEPAEPFLARNGALVLAPGGRTDAFVDVGGTPGSVSPILLHDGKEARPIARLLISSEPPIRTAPLPAASALPSNGLPARLDLKSALRVDVQLGGPQPGWVTPARFSASAAPAFRAKAGRVVVLALTNRGGIAEVFHLHGHHFRLLDRLDDGWKPFWLDTLAIEPGQTERIAFAAENAGHWLMETAATDWAAPRMLRWYSVE